MPNWPPPQRVADALGATRTPCHQHRFDRLWSSALTDSSIAVPERATTGIPLTYVPARNTIMLSLALAWAEVIAGAGYFLRRNTRVDYSGYRIAARNMWKHLSYMANLATKACGRRQPLKLHAPLLHMSKAEIIGRGLSWVWISA